MDKSAILKRICAMISTLTDVEDIQEDSELIDDLDISSMDVLMILASLEEEFQIKVPEKLIRRMVTVGDMVDIVSQLKK